MNFRNTLVLGLVASFAAQASADILIGNLPNTSSSGIGLAPTVWLGMGFTTDNQQYEMTSVNVELGWPNTIGAPIAQIYDFDGSAPGNPLHTLVSPGAPAGAMVYSFAPSSTFVFQANTTYFLVLSATASGSASARFSDPPVTPTGTAAHHSARITANAGASWGFYWPVNYEIEATPVPEPATFLTIALGIGAVALRRRRRA